MAIVIRKQEQPSPLTFLLGGLGQGLMQTMLQQQEDRQQQLRAQQVGNALQNMPPNVSPTEQLSYLLRQGVPLRQALPITSFGFETGQYSQPGMNGAMQQQNISPLLGQFIQQGLPQNVTPRDAFSTFLQAGLKPSEAATTATAVTQGRAKQFDFEMQDLNRRFKERAELLAKPFIREGFNTNFFDINADGAKEGLKQLNKLLKAKANSEIKLRKKYGLDVPEDLQNTVRLETSGQGLGEISIQVLDRLNEMGISDKPLQSSAPRKLDPSRPEDLKIARDLLQEAGGDKQKAKELARQRGFIID